MRQKKKFILFISSVLILGLLLYLISEVNYSSLIKREVKDGYSAVLVEKYNRRKNMDVMTSVKIRRDNSMIEGFPMRSEIMNYSSIGDSIIKVKDENRCYVKKKNGESRSFYYVRITMEVRNHWTFPKEWRNKWMESSKWDTLR